MSGPPASSTARPHCGRRSTSIIGRARSTSVYRDAAAGAVAGGDLLTERLGAVEATLSPLQRKADDELLNAVRRRDRSRRR